MAKYSRFTGKVFGGNATATGADPQIAQFGSALAGTFIGTTDPETIQSLPAWGQGWIGAVTPETQFPPMPEMTGAMKVLSHQICGIQQQGVPEWDNGTIYYDGNFCSKNGIIYVSTIDENQGNDPENDTVNWRNYGGADIDLSNLSETGEKHFLNKSQITNCILEIPQRIKYTLVDGTLTIKAGSVVIVPYGVEDLTSQYPVGSVFIHENFKVYDTQYEDGKFFVWAEVVNDIIRDTSVATITGQLLISLTDNGTASPHITSSGTTITSASQEYTAHYDITLNNIQYFTTNLNAPDGNVYSLPICYVETSNNVINSINQIFNGMGYIGSTIWVDKGVKGLIPNGRNEDGTLKNIEVITNKIATFTNTSWTGSATVLLGINYLDIWSDSDYHYNEVLNTTKYRDNTTISKVVKLGNCTLTSGVISDFQPKEPVNLATKDMIDSQWVASWLQIRLSTKAGTYNFDLSDYLPQDGYIYEVICKIANENEISGTNAYVDVTTDMLPSGKFALTAGCDNNLGGLAVWETATLPVKKTITVRISSAITSGLVEFFAYRRLGTNV